MKKLLLACSVLALSASAHADFHAAQPFDGGSFECSIVRQQPQDRDTDPVYNVNVNVMLSDMGKLTSIGVVHTVRTGKKYDRSEQYTDGTIWQTPGRMEWSWSGHRGPVQMVGVIYHNDCDGWMYRETISKNGHVEYQMLSDCHEQQSED